MTDARRRTPGTSASARERRSASSSPQSTPQALISSDLRQHIDPARRAEMVAEAAYFYAEHRGFEPGHELEDWIAAEEQIEAALALAELQTRPKALPDGDAR